MLRDIEELVSKLGDDDVKGYMEEALRCYHVGSYRACIVLSVIAAMYDLHSKIRVIAGSLKAARELDEQLQSMISKQEPYEKYMIEQSAVDKLGILSPSERDILLSFMQTRNRCAHPGGHFSSAEEARALFTGVIDIVMSKPALLGASYKNVVLEEIKEEFYFPDHQKSTIEAVATELHNKLHSSAVVPICKELVRVAVTPLEDRNAKINAGYLLAGLSTLIVDVRQFVGTIKPITDSKDCLPLLFLILGFNASLMQALDSISRAKVLRRIAQNAQMDRNLTIGLFREGILTDTERDRLIGEIVSSFDKLDADLVRELLTSQRLTEPERSRLVSQVTSLIGALNIETSVNPDRTVVERLREYTPKIRQLNIVDVDRQFYEKLLELVSNSDFYLCNSGVNILVEMGPELTERMPSAFKAQFVAQVLRSAGRNANSAKAVLKGGFSTLPDYVQPFVEQLVTSNDEFNRIVKEVFYEDKLVDFLIITNNLATLERCLTNLTTREFDLSWPEDIGFSEAIAGYKIEALTDLLDKFNAIIEE